MLSKSCKAFSQSLFDFMEWESDYKYRMRGNFEAFGDEPIMVFSLDEPEIIKSEILEEEKLEEIEQPEKTEQMEAQLEESKDKKHRVSKKFIWMYPGEWAEGFGEKADQQYEI